MTGAPADPQELLVRLLDPGNRADPYPLYREIRECGPLLLPGMNLAVFSRYDDCFDVLRHPDSASDRLKSTAAQRAIADGQPARPLGTPAFLFLDPPDHTRLRKLTQKAFAPKVIKALEADIALLVDGLLDKVEEAGHLDVITDLAYPLPVAVICRLLGVPLEDEPEFSRASALLARSLDPFITVTGEIPDDMDERMQAGLWMRTYLHDLIDRRRADPGEDLMSRLIAAEEDGDQLTEEEIVATCNLLLIAGHETTVNLIANAVLAMLREPRHWATLGADPTHASAIIEETLRHDPPVQLVSRVAAAELEINGVTVPRGDTAILLIAAAQRDPASFVDPDVFDPDRAVTRHLAFGHGPHFCLGAPLARLEAQLALTMVTSRFPDARLDGPAEYKPNLTLRGLAAQAVRV
ncbi:cytochrome P450 [Mycolicibacterium murale]|uniref:cytochrome P450 n=1 Tax=Mycolicibacterium murale TaxID=182220 RepID=UPI00187351CF|nr:cytochrome P450 [Mycolicibacterium murale]MCV7182353.1 cytochrome P450 [Mycolicibacterium murale]